MHAIRITIKNWQKYNPRTDRANHSWFRLENSILTSEDLFGLKMDHKWVWICLLCLASKKGETFDVDLEWLASTATIPFKTVVEAVRELMGRPKLATIEIIDGNHMTPTGNQPVSLLLTTNGRNERDVTNVTAHLPMLDTAYKIYPLKKGKSKGMEKAVREVKTVEDAQDLIRAVTNYKKRVEADGTESKYIKHFSTFMGEWRDWLDPEAGTSLVKPSKNLSDDEFFAGIRSGKGA